MSNATLIAAWNLSSATANTVPSGVTGTSLFGLTLINKVIALNAWTIVQPAPAILEVDKIINAILPADLIALTSTQIALMQLLFQGAGTVDASPGTAVRNVFVQLFSGKTTTLANLTALVSPFDNATTLWVTANGFGNGIATGDATALGLS